jgi:protoheme IX farnesyltransferase
VNGELRPKSAIALTRSRLLDFILLGKPELTLLSVITAVGSAYLATPGTGYGVLFHVFAGTLMIGSACGMLNEYMERRHDALMKRTERRPIPAGRVTPAEALLSGNVLAAAGLLYLAAFTTAEAAILAALTLCTYLFLYTPLKRRTPFATIIGGIPGGIPPLIGWAAVRGSLSMEAWSIFFILFFWQMPHFLSLAWMYRRDYEKAGFKMLTVVDPSGVIARRQILIYSAALVPAALMPTLVGLTGIVYFVGALLLSTAFFLVALRLVSGMTNTAARSLFFASLIFLPVIFFLLMIDRIPRG